MNDMLTIEPGQRVGNYVIEARLGNGSEGLVFLARDLLLGRQVALKTHRSGRGDETRSVEEARTLARLEHPNIIRVYHAERSGGTWFVVYEYISGGTLHGWVERSGPLGIDRALELTWQAADGLAYAHAVGIMHRDVKPQNLMLTAGGRLKVGDFGLALDVRSQNFASLPNVGTPAFLAPELWAGETPTPAADVYSLGACLFYMLKGHPPFQAADLEQLRRVQRKGPPALDMSWPAAVRELLVSMLDRDPLQRPSSTTHLLPSLQQLCRFPDRKLCRMHPDLGERAPMGRDGMAMGLQAAFRGSPDEPALVSLQRALNSRVKGVRVHAAYVGDGRSLVTAALSGCETSARRLLTVGLRNGRDRLVGVLRGALPGLSEVRTLPQFCERLRAQQARSAVLGVLVLIAPQGLSEEQEREARELLHRAAEHELCVIYVLGPGGAGGAAAAEWLPLSLAPTPPLAEPKCAQVARFVAAATDGRYHCSADCARLVRYLSTSLEQPWTDLAIDGLRMAAASRSYTVASWAVFAAQLAKGSAATLRDVGTAPFARPERWPDAETQALLDRLRRAGHVREAPSPISAQEWQNIATRMGEGMSRTQSHP